MAFSKEQQKTALIASIAAFILLNGYRSLTREEPKTAPLVYPRGTVASTPVRQGVQARSGGSDPLSLFIARQAQPYPGVSRDIFRMAQPAARPAVRPVPAVVTIPLPTAPPERSPQEIAADRARADLAKFRYLGYLTEKDNTLFLSKDGELFIVKVGGRVLNTYTVKDANKDAVVLLDTATNVEQRVEMAGDGAQQAPPQQPQRAPQPVVPQQTMQPKQQPPSGQSAGQLFRQRRMQPIRK